MQRMTESAAKGSTTPAVANGISTASTEHVSPVLTELLAALQAMRVGDFSIRMSGDSIGIEGKIADTFNEIIAANQRMAKQLERVGEVVGREGKTKQRIKFGVSSGAWGEMESSINALIDDLVWPTTEVTRAITAVAQGDLLKTLPLDVDGRPLKGEFLRSATIVNTMIKQLGVFTSEVTRVAREVGTEGKLGGQAQVPEVTGVWKDLTESVNSMASNLTAQVRNLAEVTIAVANGDLSKKITVDVRGEILQLKEAINTMVDQLAFFRLGSDARGARSRHRRQARRPGHRAGRRRHLEGFDRQRQPARRQPDHAGSQHRAGHHRRGARRLVAQDHRRCARRNSGAERHHQYHGGPAQRLCRRSDARGARSRHRRQARRPGPGAGRRRHLEGFDRQRQFHGRQFDGASAQYRRSIDRHRRRRLVEKDHGERQR